MYFQLLGYQGHLYDGWKQYMDFTEDLQPSQLAAEAQTRQSTMDESIPDTQAFNLAFSELESWQYI